MAKKTLPILHQKSNGTLPSLGVHSVGPVGDFLDIREDPPKTSSAGSFHAGLRDAFVALGSVTLDDAEVGEGEGGHKAWTFALKMFVL